MISMKDANVMKNGLSKNDPLRSWVVSAQERLLQEEEQAKEMKNKSINMHKPTYT